VRANVKTGTTLLTDWHRSYPGLTDYRYDPRTAGKMAGHVVLPWVHRVFALMKRWGLGTYHGLRRKHIDTYLNEFVFRYNRRSTGTSRSKPCSGSPRTITRRVTGISSGATIPAKACRQSGASRGAEEQRPECGQTDQDPKNSNPAPFWI